MKGLITNNLHIKILALLSAALFWFVLLSSSNTFFEFPDQLEIEAFNVPEGLAVVNDLGTAQITIRADQELYKTLTPDNFTVYVDLQGLAEGTKTVDISVNSKKSEVSVISINPASIEITLESLITTEIPLSIELTGEPSENYTATLVEESGFTVELSGAETVLENVSEAVAILILSGNETEDITRTVEIEVLDENGNVVNQVTVDPKTIEVNVVVELEQSQKTVGVKINVEELADGWISSLTSTPQVVQIYGDADVLNSIEYLETETIEVSSGESSVKTKTELILPDG
ncbi:MAG: CdaR family protein, partial [Candidatus Peregrinibacteria bacterium]|nr:CdaR family protein [Candidatus Peregrinibacteria bacterium]